MKSVKLLSLLAGLSIMFFMLDCTKNIAGSEVTNEKFQATIYLPNSKPAKNATVLIVPADYIPASGLSKSSATMLSDLRTSTDDQGHYSVNGLADGCYNVWAELDSLVMLHDSIYIASTSLLQSISDTLNLSASLSGVVKIQPNHNVATVIIQALGTNIYANVNSKGQFNLPRLAKGDYQLKFSTSISGYVPKFVSVGIRISKPDTIKDTIELTYTGIPVVTNIQAWYDSLSGKVRISWHPVEYFDLSAYLVYRAQGNDDLQPKGILIGVTTDTIYYDTIAGRLDSGSYQLQYRVLARDNSLNYGLPYKSADVAFTTGGKFSVNILDSSQTVSSRTLFRAEIQNPSIFISKVEWWIDYDTLIQSHVYSTSVKHAIDSVRINYFPDTSFFHILSCRAIDNYGHVAIDSTYIYFTQDTVSQIPSTNQFSVFLAKTNDTIFVDSLVSIFASVYSHYSPIKQIAWRTFDVDSVKRSVFLSGQSAYGADTAVFSWHSPGIKTVYCSVIDSINNAASDSTFIWVKPQ
jgi:hypothetical protein